MQTLTRSQALGSPSASGPCNRPPLGARSALRPRSRRAQPGTAPQAPWPARGERLVPCATTEVLR